MRVCYLCSEYSPGSVAALEALSGSGHEVVLVVAHVLQGSWCRCRVPLVDLPLHLAIVVGRAVVRAARATWRKVASPGQRPVERFCRANGMPVIVTHSRRIADHADAIARSRPDVLLSNNWPFRIPQSVCRLAAVEAVNCHGSLLPAYRGPGATVSAIIDGAPQTGVTAHVIERAFDSGPILAQEAVPSEPGDTVAAVRRRKRAVVGRVILEALEVAGRRALYRPNPPSPYYERCATATYVRRLVANRLRRRLGLQPRPCKPSYDFAGCPGRVDGGRGRSSRPIRGPRSARRGGKGAV